MHFFRKMSIWAFASSKFLFKKQKFETLPMTQQYIHAHQILKRQLWHYLMTRIWFLIGLQLIAINYKFQIMFLGLNIDNSKITFMIQAKLNY